MLRNGDRAAVEDRPDFAGQLFQRERLLKEVVFDVDYSVVHYRLAGVARDEQHPGLRTQRFQFLSQLASTHVRHYDVGNCQMDRRSVILAHRQGIDAVSGFQHRIAAKPEELGGCPAQGLLILDQQHGLCSPEHRFNPLVRDCRGNRLLLHARQVDFEYGTHSSFAVGPDESMILFDDAIHCGQAESRAFAERFGGEEGLKNVRQVLSGNTVARIGHGQHRIAPCRNDGVFAIGVVLVEVYIRRLNRELPSLRHRIARVGREVHKDLFDLHGIKTNSSQSLPSDKIQLDIFSDESLQDFDDSSDHRVQFSYPQRLRLLATESQQLPGQIGGTPGGGKNLLDTDLGCAPGDNGVKRQFRVAGDDGQQVVEVMGNASCQPANGVHFLGLKQLGFDSQAFAEIAAIRDKVRDLPFGVLYGSHALVHVIQVPILLAVHQNVAVDLAGTNRFPQLAIEHWLVWSQFTIVRGQAL